MPGEWSESGDFWLSKKISFYRKKQIAFRDHLEHRRTLFSFPTRPHTLAFTLDHLARVTCLRLIALKSSLTNRFGTASKGVPQDQSIFGSKTDTFVIKTCHFPVAEHFPQSQIFLLEPLRILTLSSCCGGSKIGLFISFYKNVFFDTIV